MTVNAGDAISAEVTVAGTAVTLAITDTTTASTFTKTLTVTSPDTSSAEWIAEAPSQCMSASLTSCRPLPLAPFGTTSFSAASATANGHTGVISDAAWTSSSIALRGVAGGSSAAPSVLGADGASFAVTTSAPAVSVVPPTIRRVWWGGWWRPRHQR